MEYYTQNQMSAYTTTVHQWTNATSVQNPNNVPKISKDTDFGQWHTYGCLWMPNRLQYYFDNKLVITVATGPGTPFTALEQEHVLLMFRDRRSMANVCRLCARLAIACPWETHPRLVVLGAFPAHVDTNAD